VREETLKRFFQGDVSASDLAQDVAGSTETISSIASRISIEDMDSEFSVTRPMLVSLADAVFAGTLPPDALGTIGFALQTSDKFVWDGDSDELVANVISDWSCPEINYPLTHKISPSFVRGLLGLSHIQQSRRVSPVIVDVSSRYEKRSQQTLIATSGQVVSAGV